MNGYAVTWRLAVIIALASVAAVGACGEKGSATEASEICRGSASTNAVDATCAEFYAKQALVKHQIDPAAYKRFEARFLSDRRVWIVTARFEPAAPDRDKDIVVALDGAVQFVP